jgi:hypothetical protein
MALPDVPPMGRDWEGENSVSGNERRRRASELPGSDAGMMRMGSSFSGQGTASNGSAVQSVGDSRPARLINLGQKIRANSIAINKHQQSTLARDPVPI